MQEQAGAGADVALRDAEPMMRDLTETVWASVLGLPIQPCAAAGGEPDGTQCFVTGCVTIGGAWEGAVALRCTTAFARRAASVMFEIDKAAATSADVVDALGELANILGGNLKAVLPGPSQLSLPSVVEGADYVVAVPGGRVVCGVWFECEGAPLLVSLLAREPKPHHHGVA